MPYYQRHIFFCTNFREDGSQSCQQCNAQAMRDYAKQRAKQLGIAKGKGTVRIYVDQEDIDEIIDEHLLHGRVVKRLQI